MDSTNKNPRSCFVLASLLVLFTIFFICVVAGATWFARRSLSAWIDTMGNGIALQEEPTQTAVVVRPSPSPEISESDDPIRGDDAEGSSSDGLYAPDIQPEPTPLPPLPEDTFEVLENSTAPVHNPLEVSERLTGKVIPHVTGDIQTDTLATGARDTFWVINADTNRNFQVEAVLRQVSDHLYFWVEDGLEVDQHDINQLIAIFENDIYPTTRSFFGSEWTPGIDGDPHMYILYTSGMGSHVAGLFSPGDEYPPLSFEYSNAHEMFTLNADTVDLDETFTYGVLAHEYQHMIQWHQDRNEQSWLNEGLSELAMLLNGYGTGGVTQRYAGNPDVQLNYWPREDEDSLPHYGASYLYLAYFLDRFGPGMTQALATNPANGLQGVDNVLSQHAVNDPQTGEAISADDVFADWVVASYLQDGEAGDGRYAYHNIDYVPQPQESETIGSCPSTGNTRTVHQYGVDYVRITCRGEYTLNFEGSVQVNLLPADAHSGEYAFWSNAGDELDSTLTRRFDFTGHNRLLTLNYWTWYDLENGFDYVYLMASTDGERWEILQTPSGTLDDPSGSSYGWAYNGRSGAQFREDDSPWWIQESVDISQFAGQQVYLRFEYLTDAAVYGEGFLLDDIAIPETGYATGFEGDDGGWESAGFVRTGNQLPQRFRLALIRRGATTTVEQFALSADNTLSVPIEIGPGTDEVILVISGTTRFTRQPAAYRFSLTP